MRAARGFIGTVRDPVPQLTAAGACAQHALVGPLQLIIEIPADVPQSSRPSRTGWLRLLAALQNHARM